jgi:FSR family fosmidomycin resistance protein-like MFS transporter
MLSRMSAVRSSRLALVFSSVGHGYMHLFSVYFYLVVLPLEREWRLPYSELIGLWTIGSLLIGALALPVGWIADRWSATGMMVVFFVGLGGASIACGLAPSPDWLWVALCLLGAFAAIYHPVGLPWLVRTSESRGKALGINGIFGSGGVAAAGLVAGSLIDLAGWRAAFVVPGAVSVATGLVMWSCVRAGLVSDGADADRPREAPASRGDRRRAFGVLLVTMFGGALIYQSTLAVLPKLFEVRLASLVGTGTFGIGALVAIAYGLAGLSQIAAGHLADRYPLKRVYVLAIACQAPLLWLAARAGGLPLVPIATAMIIANTAAMPAENILLAEAAPERRQSVAFGVKFVLSFGAAPVAIRVVAFATEHTAGLYWLFAALAVTAAAVTIAALFLPSRAPASAVPA